MPNPSLIRFVALALAIILIVLYGIGWPKVDPRKEDFAAFYSAARLYQEKAPVYDVSRQCEIEHQIGASLCLPFVRPPVELPLLALLSTEDYKASYWRWAVLMLLVFTLCALPLFYLAEGDYVKIVALLAFYGIFQSLLLGQDSAIILLAVLTFALLLRLDHEVFAGLVLSFVCLKPHFALALALPLAFCRWKAFAGFCAGAMLFIFASFLLVGSEGLKGLAGAGALVAQGTGFGANQHAMPNIEGLIVRAGLPTMLGWPMYAIGIVSTSLLWRKYGMGLISVSIGIVIALLTVPHVHVHDLVLLVIPGIVFPVIVFPLLSIVFIIAQAGEFLSWLSFAVLIAFGCLLWMRLPSIRDRLNWGSDS